MFLLLPVLLSVPVVRLEWNRVEAGRITEPKNRERKREI